MADDDEDDGIGFPLNSLDPDRDINGLDRDRDSSLNNLCDGQGADADFLMAVSGQFACAATHSITTDVPANVTTSAGDLLMISPTVIFGPGFYVGPDG